MADAHLKLQHAHATNALNYGHLGTATYLEHSQDWAFLRGRFDDTNQHPVPVDQSSISAAFPFEYVGDEVDDGLSESEFKNAVLPAHTKIPSQTTRFRQLPEILPLGPYYHRQGNAGEAQDEDFYVNPALRPCQLAFGGAAVSNFKNTQTVPVAAVVSGKHSEAVRLLLIGKESCRIENAYGTQCQYQIPKIEYDEEVYWYGDGDPIQQVCFAAACDYQNTQSAWLAARSSSRTTIFHPLFHKDEGVSGKAASRLDPNPLLSVPISRTGEHPHSDVAFHPQDHQILAIVDVHGNWSVWKIDAPRCSITGQVLLAIHLQSAGRLFPDAKFSALQDDWHKICWMSRAPHDTDRLLVSSRSTAALFDSNGANLGSLDLRTGSTKDGQMVLDVAKSSINPTHCYVLTSTKLLLMSAAENVRTDSTVQKQMALILSWTHSRGRSDASLSLILLETAQATTILITSTINRNITACRVGLALEQSSTPISLADPAHFILPENAGADSGPPSNLLAFRDLEIKSRTGMVDNESDPVLFKAFLGRPGNQLDESLYRCRDDSASTTFGQPRSSAIPLPTFHTLERKSSKYINLENIHDFVFADEINPWAYKRASGQRLLTNFVENLKDTPTISTTNWQDVYTELVDCEGLQDRKVRPIEVAIALEKLQRQLEEQDQRPTTIQTLRELLDMDLSLQDFEATSRALTGFAADASRFDNQQLRTTQLNTPEGRPPQLSNVSDIHDQLKANWVQPLAPTEIKFRLAKDRLARSVTADLALATVTVGPSTEADSQAYASQNQREPSQDSGLGSLPSSPPSATPRVGEGAVEEPACARLRKYTPLSKSIVPLSTSRVLTNMLAHLPPDIYTNPADYNWGATEAHIAASYAAEGADKIDPRARRRAERLAASQRRRLEAQKQIVQAVEQDLAPPVVMSSQYPAIREVQSSQMEPSARDETEMDIPVSMTQPARGVFGSRVAPAGKVQGAKKSRKAGF